MQQGADPSAETAAVRKRIEELSAAARRQAAQRQEARDFERFFGFSAKSADEGNHE